MSVDLGSAHGQIILDASGVNKGVATAAAALRSFEAQSAGAGKNLDKLGQSGQQAGSQVARGAQQATQGIEALSRASGNTAAAFDRVGSAAGILGGSIAGGLGIAAKSASELETAVARVSTIAPDIDTSKVTGELSAMSTRVAQTSVQLATSLNNIFSSIDTNQTDALKLVEEFGRGAVAAGTDAETFGTSVLGVMNAYGLAASDATHISDVFFNTIKTGVISGEQLARGLGQVTQTAKLAGVDFDTLGALIAGVTREGGEASTNLNNLANALNKITTADTQKGFADLGIATKDTAGNFRSIVDVLTDLKTALDGLSAGDRTRVLQELFPDAQARAGVTTLLSQLDTVKGALADNATAAGSADAAYAKMGNTAAAQAQILKNTLVATLNDLGAIALPGLVSAAKQIEGAVAAFDDLSPSAKSAAVQTAEVAAVALLLAAGAVKVVSGAVAMAGALKTIATGADAAAKALYTYAGASGAAEAASAAIPGVLIAIGLAAAGTAISMDQAASSARRAGDAIGGDLGRALAGITISKKEGLVDFFTGISAAADKAREQTSKWSDQQTDVNDLLAERTTIVTAYTKLLAEGGGTSQQATILAAAADQLTKEIELRRELNRQEEIRNRLLTQEAEVSNQFVPPPPPPPPIGTGLAQAAGAVGDIAAANQRASDSFIPFANALTDLSKRAVAAVPGLKEFTDAMSGIQANSGPMQAALDAINTKLAQGLPLTSQEAALRGQLAGALAVNAGAYADLTIAAGAAALAEFNAGKGGASAAGGIVGVGTAAGGASGNVKALEAALVNLNSAFGALSAEDAQLTGFYNKIGERVKVLQDQKAAAAKGEGTFTPADTAELQHWLDLQTQIGNQLGINAAKERDIVDQTLQATKAKREQAIATKAAADAANAADLAVKSRPFAFREDHRGEVPPPVAPIPPPAPVPVSLQPEVDDGLLAGARTKLGQPVTVPVKVEMPPNPLVGLTQFGPGEGPGAGPDIKVTVTADTSAAKLSLKEIQDILTTINSTTTTAVIGATDNASPVAGTVTASVGLIPTAHDTVLTATDNASGVVNGLADAINNLPRSLNVTANVDISGALANINTLRANMPSSPADEGPFRTLPDWSSVFASLAPAGDAAVATTETTVGRMAASLTSGLDEAQQAAAKGNAELVSTIAGGVKAAVDALGALRELRLPSVARFGAFRRGIADMLRTITDAAGEFDGDGLDAGAKFAESATKIVGLVKPAVEAFESLVGVVQPTADQLGVFTAGIVDISLSLVRAAGHFDAEGIAGAAVLAESATKILALIKPAVEGFAQLREVVQPTGNQLGVFTQGIIDISLSLVRASSHFDDEGLRGATDLADAASQILGLIEPAVTGFRLLVDIMQPTADQLGVFTQGVIDISLSLVNASRLFTAEGLTGARDLADTAGKAIALIKPAVEGFAILPGIMQPTGNQLGVFTQGVTDITLSLVNASRNFGAAGLAAARDLADTAAKAIGLIQPAVEGFAALGDIVAPAQADVATFGYGVTQITQAIVVASLLFEADALAHAAAFATTAGQVIGLVGNGIAAFQALDGPDFALPDQGRLDGLAGGIRAAVVAIGNVSNSVAGELRTRAGDFANDAGKVVQLIGAGIAAFADIGDFTPPTVGQIDALKATILLTVQRVAQAAKEIDAESAKAAGEFAESGGKAVSLIGSAISAFTVRTSVDSEGNAKAVDRLLSTQEVDQIVALTRYAVGQLVTVSREFDKGQLAQLSTFGDAASRGFGALRGVLDAFTSATKDNAPPEGSMTPTQAIANLIGLFQSGLGQLSVLAGLAAQYQSAANTIRTLMGQAGQALAEALGNLTLPQGVTPQALALAGGGQFTVRQEIQHTFAPINISFLGDNGAWVVKSLQVDGKARQEVADMLADEIADAIGEAAD